jgi:hypothetical protein
MQFPCRCLVCGDARQECPVGEEDEMLRSIGSLTQLVRLELGFYLPSASFHHILRLPMLIELELYM